MPLSRKTLVRLAEVMSEFHSHSGLDKLFYEYNVQSRDPGAMNNKEKRSVAFVRGIQETLPPKEADDSLLEIANEMLSNSYARTQHARLVAALAGDGFQWAVDRLVATTPGAVSAAVEVTALEQELFHNRDGRCTRALSASRG
jgi:hypothetical protein